MPAFAANECRQRALAAAADRTRATSKRRCPDCDGSGKEWARMSYTIDRYPSGESPRLGAMTLQPTPESVGRARRWFRKFIAPYNPACSVEDCTLMISELVTNAICYGQADEPWVVRGVVPGGRCTAGRGAQPRVSGRRAASSPRRRRRARARAAGGRLHRRVVAFGAQSVRRHGGVVRGRRCLAGMKGCPLLVLCPGIPGRPASVARRRPGQPVYPGAPCRARTNGRTVHAGRDQVRDG